MGSDARSRFLLKWKAISQDNATFNSFKENLTTENFKRFMAEINRELRESEVGDGSVFERVMEAGNLVSPTQTVQNNVLENLVRYIKTEEDRTKIAIAVYYVIISLHMFRDGNGRTSRFLYDFCCGKIEGKREYDYFHNNSSTRRKPNGSSGSFENDVRIYDVMYANAMANAFLSIDLAEYLERFPYLKNKQIRGLGVNLSLADTKGYIDKNLNLELSSEETEDLCQIIYDMAGVRYFSSGGVALMLVAIEKGQIEDFIKRHKEFVASQTEEEWKELLSGLMDFKLEDDLFKSWTTEDFRRVIELGNWAREKEFYYLIDIFENPEDYKRKNGMTYLDFFTTPSKDWGYEIGMED
ncbi:MAG: Fic family protein [Clostridia bacterium]|nr:Fic family protein [Clostridia bacterium]